MTQAKLDQITPATQHQTVSLPDRSEKPRNEGLTSVIDNGLPTEIFIDAISSTHQYIDLVKFGWGTALVTPQLAEKIACLKYFDIGYLFGGTLFEKFVVQDLVKEYFAFCHKNDCQYLEVSNGTIPISNSTKAKFVTRAAKEFTVLSEVGYKDSERSATLTGQSWTTFIEEDLNAGASLVVTEARESGRSGICDEKGEPRFDIVEEILGSGIDPHRLLFEGPTKDLQTFFITRVGSNVNLGNIAPSEVIGLETLRLGLRSDTLVHFELERHHKSEIPIHA
jgi:phosphosulfolactate synthase